MHVFTASTFQVRVENNRCDEAVVGADGDADIDVVVFTHERVHPRGVHLWDVLHGHCGRFDDKIVDGQLVIAIGCATKRTVTAQRKKPSDQERC